jgi:hypothetical protein
MSTVSVFTCPSGQQSVTAESLSSAQHGSCASGQGAWIQVVVADPFDPAALSSSELGNAYAAGFVVMATGLVIALGARKVIEAIKG